MDKFQMTIMPDGYAARVVDPMGGMWAWDNRVSGLTCPICNEPIKSGQTAYRRPSRPWRSRRDPVMHAKCWRR